MATAEAVAIKQEAATRALDETMSGFRADLARLEDKLDRALAIPAAPASAPPDPKTKAR